MKTDCEGKLKVHVQFVCHAADKMYCQFLTALSFFWQINLLWLRSIEIWQLMRVLNSALTTHLFNKRPWMLLSDTVLKLCVVWCLRHYSIIAGCTFRIDLEGLKLPEGSMPSIESVQSERGESCNSKAGEQCTTPPQLLTTHKTSSYTLTNDASQNQCTQAEDLPLALTHTHKGLKLTWNENSPIHLFSEFILLSLSWKINLCMFHFFINQKKRTLKNTYI